MAKQYNKGRELHLVCRGHSQLFRDCACADYAECKGKPDNLVWILGTEEELTRYFETVVEIDYWRDVLCRDFYYPSEVQEQPRGLSRKQKREARQNETSSGA